MQLISKIVNSLQEDQRPPGAGQPNGAEAPIAYPGSGLKYEILTNMKLPWSQGVCVYRIRALRDFGNVKAGTVGGFVADGETLSHKGNCWIADNAIAAEFSSVKGDAVLSGDAKLSGFAWISGQAHVTHHAEMTDYTSASRSAASPRRMALPSRIDLSYIAAWPSSFPLPRTVVRPRIVRKFR